MISFLKKTVSFSVRFSRSRKKTAICIVAVLVVSLYYGISALGGSSAETRYVVAKAVVGTVESTVSGSGQVSASSQIDIKSKVSGEVLSVAVKSGDAVKAGDIIARIDDSDARVEVESARISYAKLTQPADELTILESEGSIQSAKDSLRKANDDLVKSYDNAIGVIDSMSIDAPSVLSDLNTLFNTSSGFFRSSNISFTDTSRALINDAGRSFDVANAKYEAYLKTYKNISRTSASTTIENAVSDAYGVAKLIATASKNSRSAIDYIIKNDQQGSASAAASSAQSTLGNDVSKSTSLVESSFGAVSSIRSAQESLSSATRLVSERIKSFNETLAGADELDVRSQLLSLNQKVETLANYVVRAPVDGVIAKVSIEALGTVSNGTSVATIVSENKKAVITLNEVDAVKVVSGQKATITFDAIDDLTLNGIVDSIDLVGTVSQGVVSYSASVSFTDNDPRIRSGMSATVAIVTESRENVVVVPNAAIKKGLKSKYIEVFASVDNERAATTAGFTSATAPTKVDVEIGLADEVNTEIISGLSGGEYVVKKTTTSTTTSTSAAPSILSGLGTGAGRRN